MEYRTYWPSPLGLLTLASDGTALTGLWMEGQRWFGGKEQNWILQDDLPVFDAVRRWLESYFAGHQPSSGALSLRLHGTAFQCRVWQQLLEIPCGTTVTYGELAATLGCVSARAVGGAVGKNPISIIVPCHRVVGGNGALTGYAGGVERKAWLLRHEKTVSRQ